MSDPIFGVVFRKTDSEPRPVIAADLSTVGIIGPATGADPLTFPLNTPVKVYSNDVAKVSKLGSNGYLLDAVNGINDQLGDLELAALLVIVRTAEGTDADPAKRAQQTIGNIMGSSAAGTGVHAFLKSAALLSCTPRIIIAPGYTSQMATSLDELTMGVSGSGYIPGETYDLTFSEGGSNNHVVQAVAHAVADSMGNINLHDIVIDSIGAWYESAPTVSIPAPPAAVRATMTVTIESGGVATGLVIGTPGGGYVPGQSYDITFEAAVGESPEPEALPSGRAVANSLGIIDQDCLFLDSYGEGMTQAPTATVEAPVASVQATATATVAAGANPVCVALTAVLNVVLGHAVVEPIGTNETDDESWRETLNSQRLIAVTGGVKVMDPTTSEIVIRPLSPRIAGIMVRRDHETGAPFHSAANQPVQGIVGPARIIGFALTDGANEGQQLLANNIGILVKGETGNEAAISSGGFIFIGTDNAGDDELWRFYNVTRGRDYIHLSLLRVMRGYLGRFNITGNTVQAIINTMGYFLRDLQADDHILGYRVNFQGNQNSAEEIRKGNLTISFAAEEPPVLRKITTMSSRYRPAIDAMVAQLERQLNLAA